MNKELEYNQNDNSHRQAEQGIPLVWSSVIMYFTLGLFKTVNLIMEKNERDRISEAADEDPNGDIGNSELDTVSAPESAASGSSLSTWFFEAAGIVLSLVSIYLIKKVKNTKAHLVIYGLIIWMNVSVVVQFIID